MEKGHSTTGKIVSAIGGTMMLSIIIKMLGFAKQATIAALYGSTFQTDVFFIASEFLNNISLALFSSLGIAIVPMYLRKKTEKKKAWEYATKILVAFTVISILLVLVFELGAVVIAKVLAPSYEPAESRVLVRELRIMIPALFLMCLVYIFKAILEAEKEFMPSKSIGGVQSVVIILGSVCFSNKYGITVLSIGFLVASIIEMFFLIVFIKEHFTPVKVTKIFDADMVDLVQKMLPLCIGSAIADISVIVDKIIATELGEGMVSALAYGQTLKSFVVAVIMTTTISVLFVYLSDYVSKGQMNEVEKLLDKGMSILTLILIPISIISFVCAEDIVTLIFRRGNFDAISVDNTADVLRGYAIGFVPLAVRSILMKVHYAHGDSKRPMINGVVAIACNIVFSIVLGYKIGVLGVVIATSLSYLISVILMSISIRKHIHAYSPKYLWKTLWRSLPATFFCIVLSVVLNESLFCNVFLKLVLITLVCLAEYLFILKLFKFEEIEYLVFKIKKKFRRG